MIKKKDIKAIAVIIGLDIMKKCIIHFTKTSLFICNSSSVINLNSDKEIKLVRLNKFSLFNNIIRVFIEILLF